MVFFFIERIRGMLILMNLFDGVFGIVFFECFFGFFDFIFCFVREDGERYVGDGIFRFF